MKTTKGLFYDFFRKNSWAIVVQALAILVLFFNLYLANQLAPLVVSAEAIQQRVSANENRLNDTIDRGEIDAKFDTINTSLDNIGNSLSDIKTDIRDIRIKQ